MGTLKHLLKTDSSLNEEYTSKPPAEVSYHSDGSPLEEADCAGSIPAEQHGCLYYQAGAQTAQKLLRIMENRQIELELAAGVPSQFHDIFVRDLGTKDKTTEAGSSGQAAVLG